MNPLINFIQKTTYESTPTEIRLPTPIWTVFSLLNKAHGTWRLFRRIELYRNPDNFVHLVAGHTLNYILGDLLILRIAAQCLLIATRILECIQQQKKLHQANLCFLDAIHNYYPEKINSEFILDSNQYKLIPYNLFRRVKRICFASLSVALEAFKLSMCVMDVMDAFILSPNTKNESINESIVNALKLINNFMDNKEALLKGIENNQKIIEYILIKSPISFDQLHTTVKKTIDTTSMFSNLTNKFLNFTKKPW